MWNELTTLIDTWRNDLPWQVPVFAIILICAFGALMADSWLASRRAKRIARLLDGGYADRYHEIERRSHE